MARDLTPRRGSNRPARRAVAPTGRQPARPRVARPTAASASQARGGPRSNLVSAGQILGVGLLCFAIWLLLDSRQLLNSASSSPLGVRRSVAMSLLRPIARVNEAFGLDRIVDGGNRMLGRASPYTPGGGVAVARLPSFRPKTSPPSIAKILHAASITGTAPVSPVAVVGGPPAIPEPTTERPLTILEIGDSIGEDLGYGLSDLLGSQKVVHLDLQAVGDTGLADIAYFNWAATLQSELNAAHPSLVIVMLGGNDWQPFNVGTVPEPQGSAPWLSAYASRVGTLMDEATASGAHVVWVGLPIMSSTSGIAHAAVELNGIYAAEAASHPGVSYFSAYRLFQNSEGHYAQYLPDQSGNLVDVRDPDGVHIAPPAGDDFLARALIAAIDQELNLHL